MVILRSSQLSKVSRLRSVLRSLEPDEGIRIKDPKSEFRMFITKSHSGLYAVQLVDKRARKRVSHETNLEFLNSAKDVLLLIKSVFKEEPNYETY
jgi:hypothetical protein